MKKTNIFIDFDNTIVNSTKAFIQRYNEKFDASVNYLDVENYDFSPLISLDKKEICKIFSSYNFYRELEVFDGVEEVLKLLKESNLFNIILVTNCSADSIKEKIDYLRRNDLDKYFDSKIYLDSGKPYDKSLIDMHNSILIDDHKENHICSNAKFKLCYKYLDNQNWCPNSDEAIIFNKWDKKLFYYLEYIAQHNPH